MRYYTVKKLLKRFLIASLVILFPSSSCLKSSNISTLQDIDEIVHTSNSKFNIASSHIKKEQNQPRAILRKILHEIAVENDIKIEEFPGEWIRCLEKNNKKIFVYGHQFDFNKAAAVRISADKSATSTILEASQIPHVEHFLISHFHKNSSQESVWEKIASYAERHTFNVVCKPKEGARGIHVSHTKNKAALEAAVTPILSQGKDLTLSPYYDFEFEYRVFMFQESPLLVFKKCRPYIMGDGRNTLKNLALDFLKSLDFDKTEEFSNIFNTLNKPLSCIPAAQEKIYLGWKNTMGVGFHAELLSNTPERENLIEAAKKCAQALNLDYLAVDLFFDTTGTIRILEVNSAPTIDNLVDEYSASGYLIIKRIYQEILQKYFNT